VCINCGATFLRSFVTFDHLPLVEFELEGGVSDQEAMELLEAVPPQDGGCRMRATQL
jgi:intraflagellar transport protein 122